MGRGGREEVGASLAPRRHADRSPPSRPAFLFCPLFFEYLLDLLSKTHRDVYQRLPPSALCCVIAPRPSFSFRSRDGVRRAKPSQNRRAHSVVASRLRSKHNLSLSTFPDFSPSPTIRVCGDDTALPLLITAALPSALRRRGDDGRGEASLPSLILAREERATQQRQEQRWWLDPMAPQDQADPHGARHRRRRRAGADGNVLVSASPPSTSSIARLRPLLLCALVLATLLQLPRTAAAARADPAAREEEHFIGWKGESYTGNGGGEGAAPSSVVDAVVADAAIAAPIVSSPSVRLNTASNAPSEPAMPRVEVLSWKPRAFLYRNFLNASEARHFQRAAARVLRHSTVVGEQGKSVLRGDYRTSYGCFIRRRSDPVMAEVSRRASAFVGIPELYAEDMQVLRYSCV